MFRTSRHTRSSGLSACARLGVALAACLVTAGPAPANNDDRRIWLEMFSAPTVAPPAQAPAQTPRRARSPARPAAAPTAAAPQPTAAVDVPVSHRIVVFGDSLATNLGDGLADVLAEQPNLAVSTRSRGSSGLVRDDYFDWFSEIESFFAGETSADVGVVLIGLNDRQDIAADGGALTRLTDPWKEAYAARVDRIITRFARARTPLIWVGLPPMNSSRLSSDLLVLNEIVRTRVRNADGVYVDIWQAFVDEDDRYAATGPTLEGQIARLRAGDGIHFTPPGARKAAHFVDVEIRRLLADGPGTVGPDLPVGVSEGEPDAADSDLSGLTVDEIVARLQLDAPLPDTSMPARPPEPVVGPVLPLTAVESSPGATLARGRPLTDRAARLLNERVLSDGVTPTPTPGRADDFSWPPASGAVGPGR